MPSKYSKEQHLRQNHIHIARHLFKAFCLFSILTVACGKALDPQAPDGRTEPAESATQSNEQAVYDQAGDFSIRSGDVTLAATLVLPPTAGPHPALIFVQGSDTTGRESSQSVPDFFAPRGVAVLHYDKRGTGESTGVFRRVNASNSFEVFDELASDVLACVNFLKRHKAINPRQIGLNGSSQGGWIAPLVAFRSKDIAFLIIRVGPTIPVGVPTYYQNAITGGLSGPPLEISDQEIERQLKNYNGIRGFDSAPVLKSISIPGIWFYGGKDRLVPTAYCIKILEEIIQTDNKDFIVQLYPNVDHQFQHFKTGIRGNAVNEFWNDAYNWLRKRVDIVQ